jgi:peptide chain release factor 3
VAEAGAVKARRNRRAVVSDWMQMERERGISVSSTALRFDYGDTILNLLDTPGHRDFSEDTLRVLAAADSAVILLDAARGIEEQTLKLFEVARERRMPLITFVNKYDRPGREPLSLIDEIESVLGLKAMPVTWPVGPAGELRGVIDLRDGLFHRFQRTPRGATPSEEEHLDSERAAREEGPEWEQAEEEAGLLDAVGSGLELEPYLAGEATPVFFGSALSNFGVRLLLESLIEIAPAPRPRRSEDGERALEAPFSGLVFKLQANIDPRHRDRLAFLRVCSGRFERGLRAVNARTGKTIAMSYAHELFGQRRETLERAWPGDVVGLVNAGDVQVGDTLYADQEVRFTPIPIPAPDHFARVRSTDTALYKRYRRGLDQLDREGVVHVYHEAALGAPAVVLGGAGPMQFEVARHRLEHEFGAAVAIESAPWRISRLTDEAGAQAVERWIRGTVLAREEGTRLAAFRDEFELRAFERDHPDTFLDRFLIR